MNWARTIILEMTLEQMIYNDTRLNLDLSRLTQYHLYAISASPSSLTYHATQILPSDVTAALQFYSQRF